TRVWAMWPRDLQAAVALFGVLLGSCATSLDSDASSSFGSAASMAVPMGASGSNSASARGVRAAQNGYATPSLSSGDAYKIGPSDVLQIFVFKVPELSQTVQVADTGTVNLPLVGEIPAAGKTAHDLERELTRRLGAQYLQNPQVTIYV